MLDGIAAAPVLRGVRGAEPVDREALASLIQRVSDLVADFPQIAEVDLNPVFATPQGATAVDVRMLADFEPAAPRQRFSQEDILRAMSRIMKPKAVAVIGASSEEGKIGNAVMKNLINGGYQGAIYPINPRAAEILGRPCFKSVLDIPGGVDVAIFAIPAKLVPQALEEVGKKDIPGAILIPSGFAETGNVALQREVVAIGRRYNVRLMGPNKADIDEDDLLTFFEQDDNTRCIALHMEDLKDGRSFVEIARRVSRKKPIIVLKAGRTAMGARAARSHTGALAGDDKVYDDIFRQSGVIRAPGLNEMLEYARALPLLPTPRGENVLIITGAGGSGVLLSDACVDNGLQLMSMPPDLDATFKAYIPPFGASGNPVDITGGEPPTTYRNTIKLALEDERVHALILGYWHTIVTPPMVFARVVAEIVEECRQKGIDKPIVASLAGDVEVEEASAYLFDHRIVAYPYTTEKPVAVLGAKYQWARTAGFADRV